MVDSREPKELFDALHRLEALQHQLRTDSLWPFLHDMEQLHHRLAEEDGPVITNATSITVEVPTVHELERDKSWCPHRTRWTEPENGAVSVICSVLFALREAADKLDDIFAVPKEMDALWGSEDWDAGEVLIELMADLQAFDEKFEETVLAPLRSNALYLGCINTCGGSQTQTLPHYTIPPQPPSPPPVEEGITDSMAFKKVVDALDRLTKAFADTDGQMRLLHHFARLECDDDDDDSSEDGDDEPDTEVVVAPGAATLNSQTMPESEPTSPGRPHPINKVSVELLAHIVRDARKDDPKIAGTVGAVNRHLSEVANNTPSLWDSIHVMTPIDQVLRCIANSKNQLLDVSLSPPPSFKPNEGLDHLKEFVKQFKTEDRNRIQSFTAITTESSWSRFAIEFLETSAPDLSQLTAVSVGLGNPYGSPHLVIDAPSILAKIIDLSVHRVHFRSGTLPSFPKLLKLKVEQCMTRTFQDLGRVISGMSSLQYLVLRDIKGSSQSSDFWEPPTYLSELTSMQFDLVGVVEIGAIFSTVVAPNLKSLVLSPWGTSTHDADPAALRTIVQSHASGVLELHLLAGILDDWHSLLADLRALTHLHIRSCAIVDDDLATLAGSAETRNCPNLAHIGLDKITTISSGVLKTIVEDRHENKPSIETLIVRDCYEEQWADADIEVIREQVPIFKLGWLNLQAVSDDQENSMGNTSSVDESWTSGDISSSCMTYIPTNWLVGNLEDRWMNLRSGRQVFPLFPNGVTPLVE